MSDSDAEFLAQLAKRWSGKIYPPNAPPYVGIVNGSVARIFEIIDKLEVENAALRAMSGNGQRPRHVGRPDNTI